MMTENIEKIQELNKEIKSIQTSLKTEMFEFIMKEFLKRGFVVDPKGEQYKRSLYNPDTKINIHVANIGSVSASILVNDMVDDGMTWGKGYHKLTNGTNIKFNFRDKTFERFYNTTYTNRVNKLKKLLAD